MKFKKTFRTVLHDFTDLTKRNKKRKVNNTVKIEKVSNFLDTFSISRDSSYFHSHFFHSFSISSSDLPLVSGTIFHTKRAERTAIKP